MVSSRDAVDHFLWFTSQRLCIHYIAPAQLPALKWVVTARITKFRTEPAPSPLIYLQAKHHHL